MLLRLIRTNLGGTKMNCRNCIYAELIDNEHNMFTYTKYAETVGGNNECNEWKAATTFTPELMEQYRKNIRAKKEKCFA